MKLSIVLPFYYKLDEFKIALPYNQRFLTKDMELIISIDEPDSETELVDYLNGQNLECSFKVKSNPNRHEYRNHVFASNVGIRMAKGEYILIMSPESICVNNVYDILVEECEKTKAMVGLDMLHGGRVAFCKKENFNDDLDDVFESHFRYTAYRGSMCLSRDMFYRVNGFDEQIIHWGGEDDDLRNRLGLIGSGFKRVWEARVIHYEDKNTRKVIPNLLKVWNPDRLINENGWGMDF